MGKRSGRWMQVELEALILPARSTDLAVVALSEF
jgi:hypothetical protein